MAKTLLNSVLLCACLVYFVLADCSKLNHPPPRRIYESMTLKEGPSSSGMGWSISQEGCAKNSKDWTCAAKFILDWSYETHPSYDPYSAWTNIDINWTLAKPGNQMVATVKYKNGKTDYFDLQQETKCSSTLNGKVEIQDVTLSNYDS